MQRRNPLGFTLLALVFCMCVFGFAASAQAVTYSDLIWQAAVNNGTNPYFLAARIRQEVCVGTGKSTSVTGTVPGYTGIYNFYNIGATAGGSGPVINGLIWAKSGTTYGRPWTDPQKSIAGGANYLAESYISVGQDSRYLQKFNVAPSNPSALYSHQYMTNLAAPLSEANTTFNAYNGVGALSLGMVFYIPVYNGMPTLVGTPYTVSISGLNIRNVASTSGSIITSLNKGANVQVITWNYATNVGGYNWAKITLGNGITGYAAQGDSSGAWLTAISGGSGSDIAGFPASYQPYLKALRAKYPSWTFKPLNTNLDWNTALSNEQGGKSAVPAPATGWVAATSSPMIAQPPAWVESGTWYRASQAAVAYYMDPRNALSPTGVFEFEQLSYNSSIHTVAGVQKLLTGTFMAGNNPVTYVDTSGVTRTLGASAESNSATINKTGSWTMPASSLFSGGYTERSTVPGSEMTFKVTGTSVDFIGAKNVGLGSFAVYVDGASTPAATISNAGSALAYQVKLGSVSFSQGTHTIRVRTTTTALVDIDRIDVYGSPASVAAWSNKVPASAESESAIK